MKKSIFAIALIMSVFAGFAISQTGRKTVRRPIKKTTVKKTIVKKPIVRKKIMTTESNTVTTASGLTYTVTKKGGGEPLKAGDNVVVNYTGLFTDGRKFDSSFDPGREPISFTLGAGRVIKGWDEALQKLSVGDHATLIIPSSIAYGATGRGSIPPDTTLVFIIEVVGVK